MTELKKKFSPPEERGRFKKVSEGIRYTSNIVDMVPLPGIDDISASGLAGVAAAVDVFGKVLDRDIKGAVEETFLGVIDAGIAFLPLVEYMSFGKLLGKLTGTDIETTNPRKWARYGASKLFNVAAKESTVFEHKKSAENQPPKTGQKFSSPGR